MAKDPAFLFYDGDAARDVSHMNRLERGCYFDFVQAQKKFGPLTIESIQKILGKDFEECWPALNLILTYDNHMYFIAWLKDSIEKRQKYSESRSKNKKGKNKPENEDLSKSYVNHMEIENAIEIESVSFLNKIEDEQKISDAIFSDQIFIEKLKTTHRGKDLHQAFKECYIHHSNAKSPPRELWQWRQKFNSWLVLSKPENKKSNQYKPGQFVA
jgi:hypothetical protein